MYGVPEAISSRVPDSRPGRPEAGNRLRLSTAFTIAATVRAAATGLSREIYSAAAFMLSRAARSHSTRTTDPTLQHLLHFLVAGEVASVGLGYTFLDFIDLPFVDGNKFLDRLGGDERAAPVHRFRQTVELILEFGVQAEGENRRFRHGVYIIHEMYTSDAGLYLELQGTLHSMLGEMQTRDQGCRTMPREITKRTMEGPAR